MDLRDFPCYRAETGKSGDGLARGLAALPRSHWAVTVIAQAGEPAVVSLGEASERAAKRLDVDELAEPQTYIRAAWVAEIGSGERELEHPVEQVGLGRAAPPDAAGSAAGRRAPG